MASKNSILRSQIAALAAAAALLGGVAHAQDSIYHFRSKPHLIGPGAGESAPETVEIELAVSSPFALTVGEGISLTVSPAGDSSGITYQAANPGAMAGLSVNPATGAVTGMPSASAGTEYEIAVEAVRDDAVVAVTNTVHRILREPIDIVAVPDDIMVTLDMPFPSTGIGAQATGGDQGSLAWSLEGAPEWLEIVPGAGDGNAVLRLRNGFDLAETPSTTVTVVANDAEGREDRSESFSLAVMPPIDKLVADDATGADFFGKSVALSGDGSTAVIGAWGNDDLGSLAGAVYVFEQNGGAWTQQAKLFGDDTRAGDYFGTAVALSSNGSTMVVGAHGDDDRGSYSGSAYVFHRSGGTWSQQGKLVASDGAASDNLGASVSISADGSTALVGAFNDDDRGTNSGSAYVFGRSGGTWSQQAKLTASDGAANDSFGFSVALSPEGFTALVGAYQDDDMGNSSGSAYLFTRIGNSWSQLEKLTASDGAAGDQFGYSVALSSDSSFTALVGAPGADDRGGDSGAAYIFFGRGGWAELAKLTASDGASGDAFGSSVSLSPGRKAFVGAPGDDDNGSGSGSAYSFAGPSNVWTQFGKVTAGDGQASDQFAISTSISADGMTALVGAQGNDDHGTDSGAAYIVTVP